MREWIRKVLCWLGQHNTLDLFVEPKAYHWHCRECKTWIKEDRS